MAGSSSGSTTRGSMPSMGAMRRMMLLTVGAAFSPAVAPMPGFSGFGSSSTTNTR